MPASEQAYPAGPDGEPHLATVSREDLGHVATIDLGRGAPSEQLEGYTEDTSFQREPAKDPESHDHGPDN